MIPATDDVTRKQLMAIVQAIIFVSSVLVVIFISTGYHQATIVTTTETVKTVPIKLVNSQQTPTVENFDQLLDVNWSAYQDYLVADLSNVRFYSSTPFDKTTELYAWIENNDSWTAVSSYVWVNLSNVIIPSGGEVTIYMAFLPKNKTWDSYLGVAPNLTKVYGLHDNGANVFEFYDNFSGGVLSDKWLSGTTGPSEVSVNNGLTILGWTDYNHAAIETNSTFPINTFVQEAIISVTVQRGEPGIYPLALSTSRSWVSGAQTGASMGIEDSYVMGTSGNVSPYTGDPGTYQSVAVSNDFPRYGIYGLQWSMNSPLQATYYDNRPYGTSNSSVITHPDFHISSWIETGGNGQGFYSIGWISASPGMPGSVMPRFYFGNQSVIFPPIGVVHFVSVTLHNEASVATAADYEQEVNINSTALSMYEAANLSNVIWFTSNGVVIKSWIQSGASSSSTTTLYWLKIPFSIDASAKATIYIGFESKDINLFSRSGNEGECPTASVHYGQYDNGAQVFPFYNDFAVSSLSPNITISTTGSGTWGAMNGVILQEYTQFSGIIMASTQEFSQPLIAQADILGYTFTGGGPQAGVFEGTNIDAYTMMSTVNFYPIGSYSLVFQNYNMVCYGQPDNTGSANQLFTEPEPTKPCILGVAWLETGNESITWTDAYGNSSTVFINDPSTVFSAYHIGIFAISGNYISSLDVQWLRGVTPLPEGIMPITTITY